MKVIKIQLSRLFLEQMQLGDLFEGIERLQIINTYQYDPNNFFSMQRIVFNIGIIENLASNQLESYLKKKFSALLCHTYWDGWESLENWLQLDRW